ncbi:MAG TPA: hypothetical protein VKR06_10110 [Ktedonosporobacter sp.]|nr:hypothetical protein [Ktedonosporobacter sp.]
MNTIDRKLPEIRINFSPLLYNDECRQLDLFLNNGKRKMASPEKYAARTEEYRKAWANYQTVILRGMTEVLELSFYRPVIDVTLAPYFGHKSTPLILNFHPDPDRFVDVLTHELLHVLQTDNNKHQTLGPHSTIDLVAEWQKLFGKHERLTLAHIPLHALHKYMYLDVLKAPERLERELNAVRNFQTPGAYLQAWEYVNERDYREMVDEIRNVYGSCGLLRS